MRSQFVFIGGPVVIFSPGSLFFKVMFVAQAHESPDVG